MRKNLFLMSIIAVLLVLSGCSSRTARGADGHPNDKTDGTKEPGLIEIRPGSLGGVCLGDSPEEVASILGRDYTEALEEDISGYFGEDLIVWNFNSGIVVRFGKQSNKIIRVTSQSTDFQTDMGIKTGDTIESVYEKYVPKFNEAVSRHTGETLTGWFHIGDDRLVVFDSDINDNTRVNSNEDMDYHVEEIVLAYWKHFD